MEKNSTDNNKNGILAPLLKTLDFLLAKLGYNENSRIRKKIEPVIVVIVIILLGFIVAIFSNLINFDIKEFVGAFVGIPILLVIGSWIISVFSINEKTKRRLGLLFIGIAVFAFFIYILYENRQLLYYLEKEINTTKTDTEIKIDTNYLNNDNEKNEKEERKITNQYTFIVEQEDKLITNANIQVETQYGIFYGVTDETGKTIIEIKGNINQYKSYKITVNDIVFNEPIKNVTKLTFPK